MGLSSRAVGEEASRAEVELYKEAAATSHSGGKGKGGKQGAPSSSSSSSSTTLGDLLNWKRAERESDDNE